MTIKELLTKVKGIKAKDEQGFIEKFNKVMADNVQVRGYIPIAERIVMGDAVVFECVEVVDGVVKVDSIQKKIAIIKNIIIGHTDLEYDELTDYDILCGNKFYDFTLFEWICSLFKDDMHDSITIINTMVDDYINQFDLRNTVGAFLDSLSGSVSDFNPNEMLISMMEQLKGIRE